MRERDGFWKLEHLSDAQLLEGLGSALRTQRRALAELMAHLGEIEERRLHLTAAYGSMFDYCVRRLGMSEDEACRRIDLARLARRFPGLFPLLGAGEISLSVALVLKPVLTEANQAELLAAARGKSTQQARELVAALRPQPDVPSSVRKLPEQKTSNAPAALTDDAAEAVLPFVAAQPRESSVAGRAPGSEQRAPAPAPATPAPFSSTSDPRAEPRTAISPPRARIEPLSVQRYRVQFTADAALKEKLEQARELLRHANPSGDFAPIVSRALDLLLTDLLRRRFGAGARPKAGQRPTPAHAPTTAATIAIVPGPAAAPGPKPASLSVAAPVERRATSAHPAQACPAHAPPAVPRAARRAVLERDGFACAWVDAQGQRCGSRAWLQIDHCHPRGKGGGSEPENLRLLCRSHNLLAAEQQYGRAHMARWRTARERSAVPPSHAGAPS